MLDPELARAGALLTSDLGALCANWRLLQAAVGRATCAAVLKADAYGLGAARVAPALAAAGCRRFFVAHLDEAIALKPLLPADASVAVLHGPMPGAERAFVAHGVLPVINSLPQLVAWRRLAGQLDRELEMLLQVDTGMSRMGLPADELRAVASDRDALAGTRLVAVMSHLACADEPAHPANARQLARFVEARRSLPRAPASLANSSGIFLGADYHFDLVRPGAALFGIAPVPGAPNPMRPVVRVQAKVVQCRDVPAGTAVGYGHAWRCSASARIATVAVGYADGWPRAAAEGCEAMFDGVRLPLVGRVSMDTLTVDASALPAGALQPGAMVDLIGAHQDVDAVAARAGTIGYEVLTRLGKRFARRTVDAAPAASYPQR